MSQSDPITLTTNEAAGVQDLEKEGVKFLTPKQVQIFLQVSDTFVNDLIMSKTLKSMKVGRSRRIPIAAYKKYVAQRMADG